MKDWKIDRSRVGAPDGFPFAIAGWQNRVVAWVATEADAKYIIEAEQRISTLRSDSTRHRVLWLGSVARRNR
jgi:hypothetical protein